MSHLITESSTQFKANKTNATKPQTGTGSGSGEGDEPKWGLSLETSRREWGLHVIPLVVVVYIWEKKGKYAIWIKKCKR